MPTATLDAPDLIRTLAERRRSLGVSDEALARMRSRLRERRRKLRTAGLELVAASGLPVDAASEWLQTFLERASHRLASGAVESVLLGQGRNLADAGRIREWLEDAENAGFGIDAGAGLDYEGDSTPADAPPMPEPEHKTVHELADSEGVPVKAILRGLDKGVPLDPEAVRRFAGVFKAVRDGRALPADTEAREVEMARQVVEAVKRDTESTRESQRALRERDRAGYNARTAARVREWRAKQRGEAAALER